MAKRNKPPASNSAAIRQYLLENPDSTPSQVVDFFQKTHGIALRPGAVSNIKYELRKAGRIGTGAAASPQPAATEESSQKENGGSPHTPADTSQVTLNDLLAAQDMLERFDWDTQRLLAAVDGLKALKRPR